jgi:predicted DNA-binding transcriptional regulator YafY
VRYQQSLRLLELVRVMRVLAKRDGHLPPTKTLGDMLGVSSRTIRRDLCALHTFGMHVPPHKDRAID